MKLCGLRSLIHKLHIPLPSTTIIWCDNLSATPLAYNLIFHACTKHIEIDAHFIKDQVIARQLDIRHIASHEQIANCLTKSLSLGPYHSLNDKLALRLSHTSRSSGAIKT